MIYVLVGCIICVLVFAKMALVIIPQSETKIIERLGALSCDITARYQPHNTICRQGQGNCRVGTGKIFIFIVDRLA